MPKLTTNNQRLTTKHVFAVILVGGKGKRLRPLSTDARPKAFLSVTKDRKTMFRVTVDRIRKIIPPLNILVSANKAHSRLIKKDFPIFGKENLILEPVSRNTAPSIGLTALLLKKRFSPERTGLPIQKDGLSYPDRKGPIPIKEGPRDAIMVVIPADQYIIDEKKYLDAIKKGVEFATGQDCLIVLALKPTYPATGFGYVRVKGHPSTSLGTRGSRVKGLYEVARFTEKPDLDTAKRFIRDGRYFWNAGAFIFSVNSVLRAMRELAPDIFSLLMQIDKTNINEIYKKFPDISIDYAVMEKAHNIYCVKGAYRWRDIGSFEVLKEVLKKESRSFVEKNGKVLKIL